MQYTTCRDANRDPLDLGNGPLPFTTVGNDRHYNLADILPYLGLTLADVPQYKIVNNAISQSNVLWLVDNAIPIERLESWLQTGSQVEIFNKLKVTQQYDPWNSDPAREEIFQRVYKPVKRKFLHETGAYEGSREQWEDKREIERQEEAAYEASMAERFAKARAELESSPEMIAFKAGLPKPKRKKRLDPDGKYQLTPEQKARKVEQQRKRRSNPK